MANIPNDREQRTLDNGQRRLDNGYPTLGKGHQAFRLLQVAFVIMPILAGLDKFLYLMTNWSQYLHPFISEAVKQDARILMMIAGVVEIIVGLGVWWKPQVFAYIVGLWLLIIIINLLAMGNFFDIALRDFGLMLAAFALGRLSHIYARKDVVVRT